MKKKIFLIVGRTASGKTTLSKKACKKFNLKLVKSYTTRPIRQGESVDKSDHIFITPDEVEQYQDNMAAYTEINGYQYFVTKDMLNQSDMYIIDPNGIQDLKSRCSDEYDFIIIYLQSSKQMLEDRFNRRGDNIKFDDRYKSEDAQFSRFEEEEEWNYRIVNNASFIESVSTLYCILNKELTKTN